MKHKPKKVMRNKEPPTSTDEEPKVFGELRRLGEKARSGEMGDYTMGGISECLMPGLNAHIARAPRQDRLQKLIVALARRHPRITTQELLAELRRRHRGDVIEEIDRDDEGGNIWFYVDGDEPDEVVPPPKASSISASQRWDDLGNAPDVGGTARRTKCAPISGLKDRLNRAKKSAKSR
jgi:hypothetical protein